MWRMRVRSWLDLIGMELLGDLLLRSTFAVEVGGKAFGNGKRC